MGIAKLRRINNIATMSGEKTGNAMNDAALIRARQSQDIFWTHRYLNSWKSEGKIIGGETRKNYQQKIKHVLVSNTSFKDIHDNQSALIILKKGFKKQQFKLNNKNKYPAQLKASKNQFELQ